MRRRQLIIIVMSVCIGIVGFIQNTRMVSAQSGSVATAPNVAMVTNTNATGPGSFLYAIDAYNNNPSIDTVLIEPTLTGEITYTSDMSDPVSPKLATSVFTRNLQIIGPPSGKIALRDWSVQVRENVDFRVSNLTFSPGSTFYFAENSMGQLNRVKLSMGSGLTSQGNLAVTESFFDRINSFNVLGTSRISTSTFYGGSPYAFFLLEGGTAEFTNVTFSQSSISSQGKSLTIRNSTIVPNLLNAIQAGSYDNGILKPASVTLVNSIIFLPQGMEMKQQCVGGVIDGGGNLQYPAGICNSSIRVGDPKLGPLQNNGGLVPTMALLPGSAAIGNGDPAICASSDVGNRDARNFQIQLSTNQKASCDSGAYQTAAVGASDLPPSATAPH